MQVTMPHQPRAVLIVTGAWHVSGHYHKLVAAIEARGIRTICETLPTNNNVVPPNTTLQDDVDFIRSIVAKETASGTHLTVLAHSWGGMIASSALADFAVPRGSTQGGVTDLIFMCAFVPREGESLYGVSGKQPPYLVDENNIMVCRDPLKRFYNDLEPEEAAWAESLRVAHGTVAQNTPISVEKVAWRTIPLSYIFCENDEAVPLSLQKMMVGRVESDGISVKQYSLAASHSPFLSMPDKVADIVEEVINRVSE
ncbi:hypothetical protein HC256_006373 [Beauveria bassiana]|nr:hypothetical protein HC256_006373 [Beauveria bassiana]